MPVAQHYRDWVAQIRRLIDGLRDPDMQAQLKVIAKGNEEMAGALDPEPANDDEADGRQ
jgi:hypothetical protein